MGGYYTGPTAVTVAPLPAPAHEPTGDPVILRMAINSVHAMSMADVAESGMKSVPPTTHEQRLAVCATCSHHTGARCKLCGDFTSRKAWLPHESCPIGKWPE